MRSTPGLVMLVQVCHLLNDYASSISYTKLDRQFINYISFFFVWLGGMTFNRKTISKITGNLTQLNLA